MRALTNYEQNDFQLDPAATIDLANCTTPSGLPCQSAVSPPRQRAHLPDHRIHQPLHLRHAARRRPVRGRQPGHADADRRRVRSDVRPRQRLSRRRVAGQDVHRLGRRHDRQSLSGRPLRLPAVGVLDDPASCRTRRRRPWSSTRATRSTPTRTARRSPGRTASSGLPTGAATSSRGAALTSRVRRLTALLAVSFSYQLSGRFDADR